MSVFIRDIETRSTVDLRKVGVHVYATHPTTEVLCVAYCVDDEDPKIWRPGMPVPQEYIKAAKTKSTIAVAHNAAFEMCIERHILAPKFKFPIIPVSQNFCTLVAANAMALPADLAKCLTALNLNFQKDVVGRKAMLQVTKPRKAKKGEDPAAVHWHSESDQLKRVEQYCVNDVLSERELYQHLSPLIPEEFKLWLLDQRVNDRGFFIDRDLAVAARKIIEDAYPALDAEIAKLTKGKVTAVTQVERLKNWLRSEKIDKVDDLDKEAIGQLLSVPRPPHVRRVLELRQLGGTAAVKKVDALLMRRQKDGRVRGAFQFHSAGTGRWSSKGAQVHNLKRPDLKPEEFENAIKVISSGDYNHARKHFSNPLSTIGDLLRAMICASPGHILLGADFSGIEARVTAWSAGEEKKLETFRRYDQKLGPDPYIIAAAQIFHVDPNKLAADYAAGIPAAREMRQIGKACELAFGYQGGVNAFKRFMPSGGGAMTTSQIGWENGKARGRHSISGDQAREGFKTDTFTDEQIDVIKNAWRSAHPNIVALWRNMNDQSWDCIRSGQQQSIGRGKLFIGYNKTTRCGLPIMTVTLPSGRDIVYPDCRICRANYSPTIGDLDSVLPPRGVHFFDNSSGQWRQVKVYGGLLVENLVQGIARDLLAEAMMRLDGAGFNIVGHVHDEVIVEAPKKATRIAEFNKLMNVVPKWATGLPIVAKGWESDRYVK